MSKVATTKLSSKGQVVIPKEVRKQLGLKTGDPFIVIGNDDVIILKSIAPPSMKDFNHLIQHARQKAKMAKMKRSDITRTTAKVRGRR
ncbi:AbrB/MazE/SpoVT family DNA-binding domain-containing protein [bacterium]|nr:AbrB/MazE/SpoVT family DNA-binding domain-containing protein [bacterium]